MTRYEFAEWSEAGVNIDYHVAVEHNYYSVPHQLLHERVEVRLTATVVELFLKGRRIASHPVVVGKTALLVVKINFNVGPDVVTLYVNPVPGRSEPSSNVVKDNLDRGTVSQINIISAGTFLSAIDEIRIGTEWADVVPSGDNQAEADFLGCLGN